MWTGIEASVPMPCFSIRVINSASVSRSGGLVWDSTSFTFNIQMNTWFMRSVFSYKSKHKVKVWLLGGPKHKDNVLSPDLTFTSILSEESHTVSTSGRQELPPLQLSHDLFLLHTTGDFESLQPASPDVITFKTRVRANKYNRQIWAWYNFPIINKLIYELSNLYI